MQPIPALFQALLEAGYCYRYSSERFTALDGKGHPFPSPKRVVKTPAGEFIEELIQPPLEAVALNPTEVASLERLARAWPRFLAAELSLFARAKRGELEPTVAAIVRSTCSDAEWELGEIEPGYRTIHPFVRLDVLRTPTGFKVIDVNTTRPGGVGDVIAYQTVVSLNGSGPYTRFPMATTFVDVVSRSVDEWAESRHLPGESVGVDVLMRTNDGDWWNFETLAAVLRERGLRAQVVAPEAFDPRGATAVIRSRIKQGDPVYDLLADGYPSRRCILSPLHRRFLGNKAWMFLLRDPRNAGVFRDALGTEDYALFVDAMPEIGIVEEDGVRFPDHTVPIRELSRKEWVFKDPASSSGRRMLLGYTVGAGKWEELLGSVRPGWICQRFIPSVETYRVAGCDGEPTPTKLFTKYGAFIFGNVLGGLEFMARTYPVVHGSRSTYMTAVMKQQ